MELESCLEDHLRPAEVEEANVNAKKLEDETARRDGHLRGRSVSTLEGQQELRARAPTLSKRATLIANDNAVPFFALTG